MISKQQAIKEQWKLSCSSKPCEKVMKYNLKLSKIKQKCNYCSSNWPLQCNLICSLTVKSRCPCNLFFSSRVILSRTCKYIHFILNHSLPIYLNLYYVIDFQYLYTVLIACVFCFPNEGLKEIFLIPFVNYSSLCW